MRRLGGSGVAGRDTQCPYRRVSMSGVLPLLGCDHAGDVEDGSYRAAGLGQLAPREGDVFPTKPREIDPARRPALTARYEQALAHRHSAGPVDVTHDYLGCIAWKSA